MIRPGIELLGFMAMDLMPKDIKNDPVVAVNDAVKGICTGGDETRQGGYPLTRQTRSWITSDLLNRF